MDVIVIYCSTGPIGVPIIGYALCFDMAKKDFFTKTFDKDQDVTMFYLFGYPQIWISDLDIFRNIFKKEVYRHDYFPLQNYPTPFAFQTNVKIWCLSII